MCTRNTRQKKTKHQEGANSSRAKWTTIPLPRRTWKHHQIKIRHPCDTMHSDRERSYIANKGRGRVIMTCKVNPQKSNTQNKEKEWHNDTTKTLTQQQTEMHTTEKQIKHKFHQSDQTQGARWIANWKKGGGRLKVRERTEEGGCVFYTSFCI